MSGVAGIFHVDGAEVQPGLLAGMTAALQHRGPDGITHAHAGSVALGHCRLCTTAEAREERQPLANAAATLLLVLDGRIDNRDELRRELQVSGVELRSRGDDELMLRAHETWQQDFLQHVQGDFALVLWDARERRLLCARDRIGNRQLLYHWDGRTFSFATDVQALLTLPWVERRLDQGLIAEWLALEPLSREDTCWQGIRRLLPAHCMSIDLRGPRSHCYWRPDPWLELPCRNDGEYLEYYRALLFDIVRRHSRSSHPLACEVSGGIDSSGLFAVARTLADRGELQAPGLQGYTLRFADDGAANELVYGRAVARHFGVTIKEVPPAQPPLDWYRARAARTAQFPGYPNGVMGCSIRDAARQDGSRVLLVGVGGDEWLGGSRAYYAEALAQGDWHRLLQHLEVDSRECGLSATLRWLLLAGLLPQLPRRLRKGLRRLQAQWSWSRQSRKRLLGPELSCLLQQRWERLHVTSALEGRRIGQRGLRYRLEAAYYADGLEGEERLIAESGMEIRRPYLDPALIQFAYACPEYLRQHGSTDRALHRSLMQELLPAEVVQRRSKADFMVTFRHCLPELVEALKGSQALAEWVAPGGLAALLQPGKAPDDAAWALWSLWTWFGCDAIARSQAPG